MTKIYLSVPVVENPDVAVEMPPKDFEKHSRIVDAARLLMGKKEVEADPEVIKQQIVAQIGMVRAAIAESETDEAPLQVNTVKLGLTLTVGGNIGLASAEAEASIEVEFTRQGQ